jgi:acyl-CoA dehydrogenase
VRARTSGWTFLGRPVAHFQLVQAHLVHLAQDAALVGLAADAAGRAMSADGDSRFEVAAARVLACSAASTATRAAHQVHGAMGMTRQYPAAPLQQEIVVAERVWQRALPEARGWPPGCHDRGR